MFAVCPPEQWPVFGWRVRRGEAMGNCERAGQSPLARDSNAESAVWDSVSLGLGRMMLRVCSQGLLAIASAVLISTPALGGEQADHIYCYRTGAEPLAPWDTYYYTGVFIGDYSHTQGYENDFRAYLDGNEPGRVYEHAGCFYGETREDAEADLVRKMGADGRRYRVVRTNWSPTDVGDPAVAAFTPRPIGDFRVSVPASPYEVQVCVRDHACEDGDRVRVSVDGNELLGVEIVNEWSCRAVSLGEGRHDIELYAVNGTGYKGDCSYMDGNTGELRVAGADSQTRSWRHRGGKGSRANIVIEVE